MSNIMSFMWWNRKMKWIERKMVMGNGIWKSNKKKYFVSSKVRQKRLKKEQKNDCHCTSKKAFIYNIHNRPIFFNWMETTNTDFVFHVIFFLHFFFIIIFIRFGHWLPSSKFSFIGKIFWYTFFMSMLYYAKLVPHIRTREEERERELKKKEKEKKRNCFVLGLNFYEKETTISVFFLTFLIAAMVWTVSATISSF